MAKRAGFHHPDFHEYLMCKNANTGGYLLKYKKKVFNLAAVQAVVSKIHLLSNLVCVLWEVTFAGTSTSKGG